MTLLGRGLANLFLMVTSLLPLPCNANVLFAFTT